MGFLAFCKKFNPLMSFLTLRMMHNIILYDSAKTLCVGKIWFFSCGLKCSQPIRLQYSLITNVSGGNQSISRIFCMEIIIKEKQHLRLTLLVECGQLCLSSNQIAGFFDINISGRNPAISSIFCKAIVILGR